MGWLIVVLAGVGIIFGVRLYFYMNPTKEDDGAPVFDDYKED